MLRHLLALVLVVVLGIVSRRRPIGWSLYDHSLGDFLYAVAAYLTLALLRPRWPPRLVGPLALACCLAIESFQATGIPAKYGNLFVVRWLIGTTFSWHDILCYCLGVLFIAILDSGLLRARRASPEANDPGSRRSC